MPCDKRSCKKEIGYMKWASGSGMGKRGLD